MSLDAVIWALKIEHLNALDKSLLLTLCDFYNDDQGKAWPSRELLARRSGMSVRSVTNHLESLKLQGFVLVEERINNDGGRNLSNCYYLPAYDPESAKRHKRTAVVTFLDSHFVDEIPGANPAHCHVRKMFG